MKKLIIIIFIVFILFSTVKAEDSINSLEKEVKGVLEKISPSIVKVVSRNHRTYYATGIVLDKSHIITNTIITKYPYKSIYIKSVSGEKYPAEIVGKDHKSSILILKIGKNNLTPIKQAGSYEVGDWIALVGAFYNKFPAINQGILSSASEDEVILNAPVVPGISGGAVVNKKGELIGVIRGRFGFVLEPDYTFKDHSGEILVRSPRSRSKELCVAVPMKKVTRLAGDLIKYGKVRSGWLGVSIDFINNEVRVSKVVAGSPAEKGGLRVGDIFLSIDEITIETPEDVVKVVRSLRPEQKSKIKIKRDKQEKILAATIGEAKAKDYRVSLFSAPGYQYSYSIPGQRITIPEKWESIPKLENFMFNISGSRAIGIDALPLTSELAKEFSVREGFGLLIAKVYEKSAAEKAGLRVADILVEINNQKVKRATDLRTVLTGLDEESNRVRVKLYRDGKIKEFELVPKKMAGSGFLFDPLKGMREEFNITIDREKAKKHKEIIELRGGSLVINGKRYDLDQVKKYKQEIENLKNERDKYKRKLKELKEILEREQNSRKKAAN